MISPLLGRRIGFHHEGRSADKGPKEEGLQGKEDKDGLIVPHEGGLGGNIYPKRRRRGREEVDVDYMIGIVYGSRPKTRQEQSGVLTVKCTETCTCSAVSTRDI
jgi:hypothetical protein